MMEKVIDSWRERESTRSYAQLLRHQPKYEALNDPAVLSSVLPDEETNVLEPEQIDGLRLVRAETAEVCS